MGRILEATDRPIKSISLGFFVFALSLPGQSLLHFDQILIFLLYMIKWMNIFFWIWMYIFKNNAERADISSVKIRQKFNILNK